ncbi:MAG: NAD(P)-dependent oxidoreductase [Gallionella sp.]
MTTLRDKVIFISGATRGIGREIALRCARDGAKIIITGKTAEPHAKLPGTIHSVAAEVEALGGQALAIQLDVRDEMAIKAAVEQAAAHFGGIDILLNNASAISLTDTLHTKAARLDLMWEVNMRGTFLLSQACIPHLQKSTAAHILTLSPPLNLDPKWFAPHVAYTLSKYGMSMCTLGMAQEFAADRIAINCLWPRTIIATAAIEFNFPVELLNAARKPSIMADAAYQIFTQQAFSTGQFLIDEAVLRAAGVTDFAHYAVSPSVPLYDDLFLA